MEDLGQPSSYLALEPGAAVHCSDGDQIGEVHRVLADPGEDIFDGIVLKAGVLPGRDRYVEADQIEEIFERGVRLKIDRSAAESLPESNR